MSDNKTVVSLADMASEKLFPFLKSNDRRTYKKYIEAEAKQRNILKAVVMGKGNARRFYIERRNITKLITAVKKGYSF